MSAQENTFEESIPTGAKVAYGSSSSAHMLLSGIGLGTIDAFYLKATSINILVMAWSWMAFIVWNAINDPIIGILQDKTKSDKGRRVPYLRYGAPIYAILFIWIWFPFTNVQDLLFWNHLLMLFLFDTVYSMMGLIFYSMPAEMALTTKERGNIMLYTTALGSIGTVGSIILPLVLLPGENPNIELFRTMMVILGILSGIVIFISSYYIKENKYTQMEETLGFKDSIKETFKNKAFLIVEISIFANVIMQNALLSYIVQLFDYVVSFKMDILNIISIILVFGVLAIAIVWLMNNIEKYGLKKLMRTGALIAIFGFVIMMILGASSNVTQFNKMPFFVISIPLACIAFGLVSYLLLGQPLMAECIDKDELMTGKRRETTYSGINALITKPAVSLGRFFFLMILAIYGYQTPTDPSADPIPPSQQPLTVATGVVLAFTIIPTVCLVIGFLALHFYPLDGEEWNEQKKKLQEIHKKKEIEYIEHLKKQGLIGKKEREMEKT
jgi:GPH family glycoside/pentoside/hexuronide:cation symporter